MDIEDNDDSSSSDSYETIFSNQSITSKKNKSNIKPFILSHEYYTRKNVS